MSSDSLQRAMPSDPFSRLRGGLRTRFPSVLSDAWANVKTRTFPILGIIFSALLVQLFCETILMVKPLLPKYAFLVRMVFAGADAWVILALQSLAVEHLQGRSSSNLKAVAARSFTYLPKPLLSYLVLATGLSLQMVLPPSVMVVILLGVMFLMWAPMYCAVETYTQDIAKDDDADDDGDELFGSRSEPKRVYHLTNKMPWELGFSRSVRFSSEHLLVSFHLTVLHWFSQVAPRALMLLFRDSLPELFAHGLELLLVQLLDGFVLATAAYAFLSLIPDAAKRELNLQSVATGRKPTEVADELTQTPSSRVVLRWIPLRTLFVGLLCSICSWYLAWNLEQEGHVPNGVALRDVELRSENGDGVLTFSLSDSRYRMRWLEPDRFRLFFGAQPPELRHLREGELEDPKYVGYPPDAIEVKTAEGALLPLNAFKPSATPLQFRLLFRRAFAGPSGDEKVANSIPDALVYYRSAPYVAELMQPVPIHEVR